MSKKNAGNNQKEGEAMRKIFFLLMLPGLVALNVFAEKTRTIEENNEYGGKTIERINDKNKIEAERWSRIIEYYDKSNRMIVRVITPSPSIINERGIIEQTNYYKDGVIERYEMKYTDEFIKIHGYDKLVELVYKGDLTATTIWYKNNNVIDTINYPEEPGRFTFYNIKYLEEEFLSMHETYPDQNKDNIIISAKYTRARSVVRFDTTLVDLEKTDIALIQYLSTQFGQPDFYKHFRKKVRVFYGDSYYWLFLQTMLEDQINGQVATVRYYPIALNGKLYLMCVGFSEVTPDDKEPPQRLSVRTLQPQVNPVKP
jgi:hypothetical protein